MLNCHLKYISLSGFASIVQDTDTEESLATSYTSCCPFMQAGLSEISTIFYKEENFSLTFYIKTNGASSAFSYFIPGRATVGTDEVSFYFLEKQKWSKCLLRLLKVTWIARLFPEMIIPLFLFCLNTLFWGGLALILCELENISYIVPPAYFPVWRIGINSKKDISQ